MRCTSKFRVASIGQFTQGELFIDTLPTFIVTEFMSYNDFKLTVIRNITLRWLI
jgi:hypothetical protein